ncbi:hypothetical protein Tco_0308714 [Tanacetum coccineum]
MMLQAQEEMGVKWVLQDNVQMRAVYEKMDDSLERAATTATSLDAEQDMGNINKTQSKATLNEPSSLGTSSGSGPRRQETMGDTIAQTGFENVSKTSNDSLLAGVNTPRSDEDTQRIISLKRRVKRLEKKGGSRTHRLKRLYKVGLSRRVESSKDEGLGEEDASKQGRIADIDADTGINLVSTSFDADIDMFGVHDLVGDEVVVETEVASKDVNLSVDEVTLAQALTALKSAKPKANKVMLQELEQDTIITTAATTVTAALHKSIDAYEELAFKLQAEEEEEERLPREKSQQIEEVNIVSWDNVQAMIDVDYQMAQQMKIAHKRAIPTKKNRAGTELEQESIKKQKVEEDKETTELQRLIEVVPDKEEVAIDAIPLETKPLSIVDYKIHKEGKKTYHQIIRADGSSKMYLVFSHMLKSFDREDLKTLWKLVKAKHGSIRPEEGYARVLWGDLKTMFDLHVEDQVWRNQHDYKILDWKLYDSCGVHSSRKKNVHIHMMVKKRYPLTPATITDMLNRKLQADH